MKTVTARMAFTSPDSVSRDPQRGLLRAANYDKDIYSHSAAEVLNDLDVQEVPLTDRGSMENPDEFVGEGL